MGENLHNDVIYVAVTQDVRESKSTLLWTLKKLKIKKICLLHVHLPFSLTVSSCGLEQSEIDAIQESELRTSYDSLYKYRDICTNKGVNEEDVDISMISGYGVGEGIVELIYQNNIKKLVMGAAADSHYSRGMSITSRKAEYVSQHAPQSCNMWFICKGKLIKTREGRSFDHGNPSDSFSFSGLSNSAEKPSKGRRRDEDETESPKEYPGWILEREEAPAPPKKERKEPGKSKSNGSEAESSPSPPDNYLCPITMEIMRDPQVAADGFTYEAEAIRRHIGTGGGGGQKNSPMTLQPLGNHSLVPNRTLAILINDWLENHPDYTTD